MPFDVRALLSDPNVLQFIGNAGSTISRGGSAGEALNPSGMIRNQQSQQATAEILRRLLGEEQSAQTSDNVGSMLSSSAQPYKGEDVGLQHLMSVLSGTSPTPKGMPGPDNRTIKQTPEGFTVTTTIPSAQQLNTFGTNVPAEARSSNGSSAAPFLKALLSQQ